MSLKRPFVPKTDVKQSFTTTTPPPPQDIKWCDPNVGPRAVKVKEIGMGLHLFYLNDILRQEIMREVDILLLTMYIVINNV